MKLISAIEDKPPLPKPAAPCHATLGAVRLKAMRREPEIDSLPVLRRAVRCISVFATPTAVAVLARRGPTQSVNSMCLSNTATGPGLSKTRRFYKHLAGACIRHPGGGCITDAKLD